MIYKHLKSMDFVFNEDTKILSLINGKIEFQLDKIRMASLDRFITRIWVRLSSHRRKK